MLAILPVMAYIGLLLLLGNLQREWEWRRCLLRAAVLWGTYLVVVTEGLSFLRGVTPTNLAFAWGIGIIAVAVQLILLKRRAMLLRWPRITLLISAFERLALIGAPRDSLQIEWIVAGTLSERYAKPDFHSCAVICLSCPSAWTTVRGLPQIYE